MSKPKETRIVKRGRGRRGKECEREGDGRRDKANERIEDNTRLEIKLKGGNDV